ncbi:MAG: hypothetical protein ACXWZG_02180 [Microbacterium sp.]
MTLTRDTQTAATPQLTQRTALRLNSAGPALWRVVDRDGRVIGHVKAMREGADVRWLARRFHAPSRAFRDLGAFWSADDAVDCIAFAR